MSPFIIISLLRKIGLREMNVKKFRNFIIAEFVESGIYCTSSRIVKCCKPPTGDALNYTL